MTHKEALKVLEYHQKWRKGDEVEATNSRELTHAIEIAIVYLSKK